MILRLGIRVCVYGHSPQELRCAPRNRSVVVSPLGHYAKGERRDGKTTGGGTTGRDGVMERSGNAFLVLRLGSKSLCQLGNNTDMFAARELSWGTLASVVYPRKNICLKNAILYHKILCVFYTKNLDNKYINYVYI